MDRNHGARAGNELVWRLVGNLCAKAYIWTQVHPIHTYVLGSTGKGGPGLNDYRFGYPVLTNYGYSTTMQEEKT